MTDQMDDLMQEPVAFLIDVDGVVIATIGKDYAKGFDDAQPLYTADQMREYAKKAVEAERERASQAWFNNHTR